MWAAGHVIDISGGASCTQVDKSDASKIAFMNLMSIQKFHGKHYRLTFVYLDEAAHSPLISTHYCLSRIKLVVVGLFLSIFHCVP